MNLTRITFTIAVVASLMGCVSQSTYNQEVTKANTYQQQANTYQQLNAQLKGEIGSDQAQIAQLQNLIKVTLMNAILFPEGGVQLHASGKATLDKLVPVFKTLTGQRIEVKGFTDNVPIGPELKAKFPDNKVLSVARAEDVVAYLVSRGVPSSMMVAQGFGDTQPIASNDTAQGRARNRRVELDIVEAR